MSEWKNAMTEFPKLLYKEEYGTPDDPDYQIVRWSKEYLVIAEDEDGFKHEMKAHFGTWEYPDGEKNHHWEYRDRTYGYQIFDDEGLKAIKYTDLPQKTKERKKAE